MKKIQELNTDFLFTTSNFLTGAATIFDLAGDFYEYNASETGEEADCTAIKNDFDIIGSDLKKAINTLTINGMQLNGR